MFTRTAFMGAIGILVASITAVVVSSTIIRPVHARGNVAAAGGCDRACLDGFVNQYLSALLAHDPSRAPLAKTAFPRSGQSTMKCDACTTQRLRKGE